MKSNEALVAINIDSCLPADDLRYRPFQLDGLLLFGYFVNWIVVTTVTGVS